MSWRHMAYAEIRRGTRGSAPIPALPRPAWLCLQGPGTQTEILHKTIGAVQSQCIPVRASSSRASLCFKQAESLLQRSRNKLLHPLTGRGRLRNRDCRAVRGRAVGVASRVSGCECLRSRMAVRHPVSALLAVVCLLGAFLSGAQATVGIVGAPKDVGNFANSVGIDELANFAVDQYKALNSIAGISFSKVLSAKEQVVQGTMYYLTIEVIEGGEPKQYDAMVWVKPWEGYKELESFLPSASSHYNPAVDLSSKSGDYHEKEQVAT